MLMGVQNKAKWQPAGSFDPLLWPQNHFSPSGGPNVVRAARKMSLHHILAPWKEEGRERERERERGGGGPDRGGELFGVGPVRLDDLEGGVGLEEGGPPGLNLCGTQGRAAHLPQRRFRRLPRVCPHGNGVAGGVQHLRRQQELQCQSQHHRAAPPRRRARGSGPSPSAAPTSPELEQGVKSTKMAVSAFPPRPQNHFSVAWGALTGPGCSWT